ncbi:MAG: hypothetical protein JXB38_04215, partial [Anaerolineales bacterium]|nr:hypothetical protein [Anaerolineales bacterium]
RVWIALPQSTKQPRLEHPPLEVVWLTEKPYQAGVEEYQLDGVTVRIYDREKTIADCFKFRNKVGLDVALEALKEYMRLPDRDINKLMAYAKVDRVKSVMQPYLEILVL